MSDTVFNNLLAQCNYFGDHLAGIEEAVDQGYECGILEMTEDHDNEYACRLAAYLVDLGYKSEVRDNGQEVYWQITFSYDG